VRRRTAELWLIDLDAAAPALQHIERVIPRLSEDDRHRAAQLADAEEQRRRFAAYVALRIALERAAGPEVRGVKYVRGPGVRPRLPFAGPAFSLAHTDRLALIAIATASTIGVDVERTRQVRLSPPRREAIVAAGAGLSAARLDRPGSDADSNFLQAWCRLEACAKADGRGVAKLLAILGIRHTGKTPQAGKAPSLQEIGVTAQRFTAAADLTVHDIRPPPGVHGALALSRSTAPPRLRHFPTDRRAIDQLLTDRA
jgi:4'-phosphopantetheinyl transferase